MERFNPFAGPSNEDRDGYNSSRSMYSIDDNRQAKRSDSFGRANKMDSNETKHSMSNVGPSSSKYSTSFPDPFGDHEAGDNKTAATATSSNITNRSNSVTFASTPRASNESNPISNEPVLTRTRSHRQQSSGITSFLSRATSVTSSSVSDRVSGAVGSVRSAVDSISNQFQQAVPANINERLSSTATNLIGSNEQQQSLQQQQSQSQPQSAASYLASKISSATGQFTSSAPSLSTMPVIGRQRVILILDNLLEVDWALQFKEYRRLLSGSKSGTQSTLSSFFSSATAQLTASSSSTIGYDGFDLVEQADYQDISVLANQATSTATVYVSNSANCNNRGRNSAKILRPEYVVVRQRSRDKSDYLKNVVMALDFCAVPMFEPFPIWNIFQDRQLVFSKLLRVRQTLGKETFPLIPKIYCQTYQDLINYINSSSVAMPCLIRTGTSGKGKIKIDNLQMLKNFSSIIETSCLSCTIEQYLDVKCDLIIQKMGTSLKLFKRNASSNAEFATNQDSISSSSDGRQESNQLPRQSRQASISSSVLSSFIQTSSQQQSQLARCNSNALSGTFERLSEVNARYREWVDAIMREFDNKLDAFCIKLIVASNDREYIVGLRDCSMEFLGSIENQEEDRRSFVELITSNINTILPKNTLSRESSLNTNTSNIDPRRTSGDEKLGIESQSLSNPANLEQSLTDKKKKYAIQTQINEVKGSNRNENSGKSFGQLTNRSLSVSVNQSDYLANEQASSNPQLIRRGSDRSDGQSNGSIEGLSRKGSNNGLQTSIGQSFLDQTSTALSSIQKQSLSFFKRLDSRSGDFGSSTPPLSATSDKGSFGRTSSGFNDDSLARDRDGFKSQSVDSSSLDRPKKRELPPKPPPPQLANRQSSLASYSTSRFNSSVTPNSTPTQTRQNSTASGSNEDGNNRVTNRVVRQNSALSAFEPFDPYLASSMKRLQNDETNAKHQVDLAINNKGSTNNESVRKPSDASAKKGLNFDSVSVTSGDSNSTNETNTAEDTMNNLKKTFASIFGDKCE